MSDAEFNMNKARRMEEIDRILDKLKLPDTKVFRVTKRNDCSSKGRNKSSRFFLKMYSVF